MLRYTRELFQKVCEALSDQFNQRQHNIYMLALYHTLLIILQMLFSKFCLPLFLKKAFRNFQAQELLLGLLLSYNELHLDLQANLILLLCHRNDITNRPRACCRELH